MNKPYRLIVNQKTGYRNINGNPVIIFDKRGIKFYDTRDLEKKVWEFNLPKGEYYVHAGKFSEMMQPVKYDMLPLPKPERVKRQIPEHFDIFFADNPYGATVFWDKKAMLFDSKFTEKTLPELITVYYHECGHKFWDSEDLCDRYAYNKMIEAGYNPSQVMTAFVNTLSDRQLIRKNILVDSVLSKDKNHYDYELDNLDAQKNDVIYSTRDIIGYDFQGNKKLIKHPAKGIVKGVSKNFIFVGDRGDYIPNDQSSFTIESSIGSIPKQLYRDMQIFLTGNPLSKDVAEGTKKVIETSKDIVTGIKDTVSSGLDFTSFIGKNLKWIIILLVLLYFAPVIIPTLKQTFSKS